MSETLQTSAKTLAVAALLADAGELTIAEIMERLKLSRAAAHRAVATLLNEGWAEQAGDSRRYRLGLRVVELGGQALHHVPVYAIGLPSIERLAGELGAQAHLAVPFDGAMLFIARVSATDFGYVSAPNATRSLFHTTAAGKVALAFMPELADSATTRPLDSRTPFTITSADVLERDLQQIRSRGYAFANKETFIDSGAIAAPVFNHTGRYVASVGIAANIARFSEEWTAQAAARLRECTGNLSLTLGCRSQPWPIPGQAGQAGQSYEALAIG